MQMRVRRLVASLQAGTVLPSAMLKRLAAFQRQNQLDLALQELAMARSELSRKRLSDVRASSASFMGMTCMPSGSKHWLVRRWA